MGILILGGGGYLGRSAAMYLSGKRYAGADNYFRRQACRELDCQPLVPAPGLEQQVAICQEVTGQEIDFYTGDVCGFDFLPGLFQETAPEAVVHLAAQSSAPYSMVNREAAVLTLTNNLESTLNPLPAVADYAPDCHIVKLETKGFHGTIHPYLEEDDQEEENSSSPPEQTGQESLGFPPQYSTTEKLVKSWPTSRNTGKESDRIAFSPG